jgi:selenocysteine lyase/cysteine desulfurase
VDVRDARRLFPATGEVAYFNTATVGLASRQLTAAYRECIDGWEHGFDYVRGEIAGEHARLAVARLIGAAPSDIAQIASVSAAAGLVAAQFGEAAAGQNVVIGAREYSSNHFPWRLLERKGYDVRQVPFHGGGIEPDLVAPLVDGGTVLLAFSGVQTATGHRSDVAALSGPARAVGAIVFVDGSQLVGALPVADDLAAIDVLATADHKFLMHAGRGLGYCYLAPAVRARFVPLNAGWKAGRVPAESFFGPTMELSDTASRFDNSISWIAAIGNEAALGLFAELGADAIFDRNRELAAHLRLRLSGIGRDPIPLADANRSTIVSVPVGPSAPRLAAGLAEHGIVAAARDDHLRFSVHVYNHEDDIARLTRAWSEL